MANRDRDIVDMIFDGILTAIGGALLGAIITYTKDPKKDLQSSEGSGDWHANIEPISCTNCNAVNESSEKFCFNCGHELPRSRALSKPSFDPVKFVENNWSKILRISIGTVIGFFIWLLLLSLLYG